MKMRWLLVPLAAVIAIPSLSFGQKTERGAAIGGIGGALAGAAIGKNNGNTAAGALIGGAVGLLGGAAIGSAADSRDRQQATYQAQQYQQTYNYSRAVSASDVISMSRSGVSDEVIINHIRENGVQRRPDVNEVIMLHNQGVNERVISVMQNATEGGKATYVAPAPAPVYYSRPPVVVEEHYYVRPSYYHPPHYHHYHYHRPPSHSHVHWGVSIGR